MVSIGLITKNVAKKFLGEFSKGAKIQSASGQGSIQEIVISVTQRYFSWGFENQRNHVVIPLTNIAKLQSGLPHHLIKVYNSADINRRAFHLILKDRPLVATFLATSEKKRDFILEGFCAVLEIYC